MQIGLFTEFQCPAGMSEATAFDESMAQMRAAEELGFDVVWLAELHFQKNRSVLASPLVIAAAIAAATRRVRIGIAVHVLPLGHPLHIAEDVATVDHLSRGRLELGVGRSGLPGHYEGFNIQNSEGRDRFRETFEILRKGWTEERFSYDGKYFQYHSSLPEIRRSSPSSIGWRRRASRFTSHVWSPRNRRACTAPRRAWRSGPAPISTRCHDRRRRSRP